MTATSKNRGLLALLPHLMISSVFHPEFPDGKLPTKYDAEVLHGAEK
jgi:hypothetical protein